jgi:hypothetical protein
MFKLPKPHTQTSNKHKSSTFVKFCQIIRKCEIHFFLFQSGGDDDPMSDNDLSRDGDSTDGDAMSRVPATDIDQETMETLRQQVNTTKIVNVNEREAAL